MEHRLPPSDLQRQVEECLAIYLRSSSTSAREVADALIQIAYDRNDNAIKALFRVAQSAAPPSSTSTSYPFPAPVEDTPALPASVRSKSSKLSLRFGRKNDKDKQATDATSAAAAAVTESNSWRKHFRPGTSHDRPGTSPLPEHQHDASIDTTSSSSEHPEYVRNLIAHGLLNKDDVPPQQKTRPESRNGQSDAIDEKRGFFTFNSSGKGGKGKLKVEPDTNTSASSSAEYSCVFCEKNDKTYSSKGTCKRHLEEMHVAKKYLQCNECHHKSNTVPDARKHAAQCSSKMVGWTNVKPGPKKYYSSEFAQSLVFESQQLYVEHLLELCGKPFDQRPRLSWHTKLRNLLEKEVDPEYLQDLSRRLLGSSDGWRNARWDFDRLHRACRELEFGILDHELDSGDLLKLRRRKAFMEELFASRLPEGVNGARPRSRPQKIEEPPPPPPLENATGGASIDPAPVYQSQPPIQGQQMMALPNGYDHVATTYFPSQTDIQPQVPRVQEAPPKRPLSYETASSVPLRVPPGPSPANFQTGEGSTYRDMYNEAIQYPVQQNTSMGTISPAFTNSPWPMQDQPPPYDPNFVTAANSYPTPLQSQHPVQAVTESLELPTAAQYREDLSLPEQYGQMNLQSNGSNNNMMDVYNSTPGQVPTSMPNNVNGHAMYDSFVPLPPTTSQEQAQWNSWFSPGQNGTTYGSFGGHYGNGQ